MQITVQPDLAAYLQEMIDVNGFDTQRYVNGIIEKGIRADLTETYRQTDVSAFMRDLITNGKPNWEILKNTPIAINDDLAYCSICNKLLSYERNEVKTCSLCGQIVCSKHCRFFPTTQPVCTECHHD